MSLSGISKCKRAVSAVLSITLLVIILFVLGNVLFNFVMGIIHMSASVFLFASESLAASVCFGVSPFFFARFRVLLLQLWTGRKEFAYSRNQVCSLTPLKIFLASLEYHLKSISFFPSSGKLC
jgi:hypothetical protein